MAGNAPPDHPRACGANHLVEDGRQRAAGSSPRMRGKLLLRDVREPRPRIIPAYAGQTHISTSVTGRWTDHPRACGANATAVDNCVPGDGSSPRMRGKRPSRYDIRGCRRIIPAHAGQTAYRSQGPSRRSDHPRACGANRVRWRARGPRAGSSPRMRGKLIRDLDGDHRVRIIPAHAGQTHEAHI